MARPSFSNPVRLLTFTRGQRGKNICSLVGLDGGGRVILRRRLRRSSVAEFAQKWPGCVVAMEACCGTHHLGRQLVARGHEVRLMSPEYVRPYVKAQRNDDRDAEAIAEAALRPTMRFVPTRRPKEMDPTRAGPLSSRMRKLGTGDIA
jgi:transposase